MMGLPNLFLSSLIEARRNMRELQKCMIRSNPKKYGEYLQCTRKNTKKKKR